jgi:hypothetical protein
VEGTLKICRIVFATLGVTLSLPGQIPDFTPPTPLFAAVLRNDTAEAKRLLDAGANPNEARFFGSPAIFFALMHNNPEMLRVMIEKGADVKALDRSGATTLMWAAGNEAADPEIVNELLKHGVDANAKNKAGETALAWALRRGYTPVVESLKRSGASDSEMIKQSVEKSIALLQKSGPEFVRVSGCMSCHHQSVPQMAYGIARERGFSVDSQVSQQQAKAVIAMFKPYLEQMIQGKGSLPNPPVSVGYSLVGLAAEGYAPDEVTEAMTLVISRQQSPDGSFPVLPGRPPLEWSVFTGTALSIRALQVYGKEPEERVSRAREWLLAAKPQVTEERTMQLLGLVWAKADADALRKSAQALLSEQRPDGGWAQLPNLESDAYSTGQALVALNSAGQLAVSDRAYQRGVAFLLRTQHPDGSWLVRARSVPFQAYKESGFPHGKHQWISAAGTSWAAMALSLTAPKQGQQVSQLF